MIVSDTAIRNRISVVVNAPRALMCVAAKTKVDVLEKLHKAGALACIAPCEACAEGCGGS